MNNIKKKNSDKRYVNYLSRDFNSYYANLKTFSETYFADVFQDFSPASPVNIFMEMASYVGDVLSFYLDNQVQENFLQYARQSDSIYALAYMMGYKPKITGVSEVELTVSCVVPANASDSYNPNWAHALGCSKNTTYELQMPPSRPEIIVISSRDYELLVERTGEEAMHGGTVGRGGCGGRSRRRWRRKLWRPE